MGPEILEKKAKKEHETVGQKLAESKNRWEA